jgi:hypothetical protein
MAHRADGYEPKRLLMIGMVGICLPGIYRVDLVLIRAKLPAGELRMRRSSAQYVGSA